MRNNFTAEQWADPEIKPAATAIRRCVHCGFCTATCPTYVVLGDERDSPRGRIQFMQKMLEEGGTPSDEAVHHIDRCLSCLNCRTTCPSSVDYARLVDKSRAYIHEHYRRPLGDRFMRWIIATVFPYPARTKIALLFAQRLPRGLSVVLHAFRVEPDQRLQQRRAIGGVKQLLRHHVARFAGGAEDRADIRGERLLGGGEHVVR